MAARESLQVIGLVMASITAGVIMIAGVLVYKTATDSMFADQMRRQAQQSSITFNAQTAQN